MCEDIVDLLFSGKVTSQFTMTFPINSNSSDEFATEVPSDCWGFRFLFVKLTGDFISTIATDANNDSI